MDDEMRNSTKSQFSLWQMRTYVWMHVKFTYRYTYMFFFGDWGKESYRNGKSGR